MKVLTSRSGDEPLRPLELPAAALGPRDVRVRVRAIGVNPVDWKMRSGGPLRLAYRVVGPGGPLVVGVDFAGEVVEVGAGPSTLRVGERVVGGTDFSRKQRGSYADEVVVREDQCARLPDAVSFEAAAASPIPYVTARRALVELGGIAQPGARVLVLGASGGVGIAALQVARTLGATAVGVCSTRNVALVESLGGVPVDYARGDALAAARAHGPFDVVLNAVGSDAYPNAGTRALLAYRGVVVLVAVRPQDYAAIALSPRIRTTLGRPNRAALGPVVAGLASGALNPPIERTFPLDDAESAHARSKTGKVVGKLLLIP